MSKDRKQNKSPRKIFNCQYCSNKFTVDYIGVNSNKTVKTCSNCITIVKKEAGTQRRSGRVNRSDLLKKAINVLSDEQIPITSTALCTKLKCSTNTLYDALKMQNITYNELLKKAGHHPNGMSKFQQRVLIVLHEIFPSVEIVSEREFDNLINPKTGAKLRIDLFIPSLNIAIECDGIQHNKEDHYFNKITIENGYTPSYITDKIKEQYCKDKDIKLVRIPYKRNISKTYIYNLIK